MSLDMHWGTNDYTNARNWPPVVRMLSVVALMALIIYGAMP